MNKDKILELCMDVRNNTSSVSGQTVEERKSELVELFSVLMKDYRRNYIEINEILEENVKEVVRTRVDNALDFIAEISSVDHGQQKAYRVKNGKITAEYVGLGTEIRRQKIYRKMVPAITEAIGGAVYAEWDDILAGRAEAFTDMVDALADAIFEKILLKVQNTLVAAMANAPAANTYSGAFNLGQLRTVANTVGAYGTPVIVGTASALSHITSDQGFQSSMSESMKDEFNKNGFIGRWEGKIIVQLPNTFTDETNTEWVLDNNQIYVIPVNADKPVKVTLEGGVMIHEFQDNQDKSITKETTQKVGVNVLQVHNLGLVSIA